MKKIILSLALGFTSLQLFAQAPQADTASLAPSIQTYKQASGKALKAHVFATPAAADAKPRAAIVLFHGGGWVEGNPEWVYATARRFASRGMVAIAIQYRLSDQKTITPRDAVDDANDAIRWVRDNAKTLGVDSHRVVAYGYSAGGHIAAMTAVPATGSQKTNATSSVPDALVLLSPAVSVGESSWMKKLLLGKSTAAEISPDLLIRKGQPPVYISQGDQDNVTTYGEALNYCEQMTQAGNRCQLSRFSGLGHLLSRKLDEQESEFDADPVARADARLREEKFLAALGFITQPLPLAPDSPETVVRAHLAAFNAHDVPAMLKNVAEDFTWYNIAGDKMDIEAKGRDALRKGMESYFRGLPSSKSELHMLSTNGNFVSVRERAIWKDKQGEPRSQNAFSIYEVTEGLIRRVWYYPAQK